jgi:hypothetical protein
VIVNALVHTAATRNSIALERINADESTPVSSSAATVGRSPVVMVRAALSLGDTRLSLLSARLPALLLVFALIRMLPLAAGCGLEPWRCFRSPIAVRISGA